ncbi:glycoside hydrolase family 32 protein [Zhihengliuella halotolerans]|uniref:glycoside hydrolase family 32 protein n=1 Tax=Zhihengliuella halotolerans TaxID=370736 RepID=UPI0013EE5BAD|nr:glycoside hydrolase family 32 protein [Zhihengliuella halotolerans]
MSEQTITRPAHSSGGQAGTDRLRPRIHPRPRRGWLNDPNGLLHYEGRYHVFCQYNPDSARHHRINWAHLSSPDLVRWTEHPVAIAPDRDGPDAFGCWSGVATLDDGVPTLVYTGVQQEGGASSVVLARSGDADLDTWSKLDDRGAVRTATGMPEGEGVTDVRDPFLFTHHGHRYALQGAGSPDGDPAVLLYDAEDLDDWRFLGRLLDAQNVRAVDLAPAEIWECPQLVQVDGRWVMLLSQWRWVDGKHLLSGVSYLVGELVDDSGALPFRFEVASGGVADTGPDFYAPQVLAGGEHGAGAGPLLWGWSWEGRDEVLADEAGWAGVLTLPRRLRLEGERLVVEPAAELEALRASCTRLGGGVLHELGDLTEVVVEPSGTDVEVVLVTIEGEDCGRVETVLRLSAAAGLRVFIDHSVVEAFCGDAVAHTVRAYPAAEQRWAVRAGEGTVVEAWELDAMDVNYRSE